MGCTRVLGQGLSIERICARPSSVGGSARSSTLRPCRWFSTRYRASLVDVIGPAPCWSRRPASRTQLRHPASAVQRFAAWPSNVTDVWFPAGSYSMTNRPWMRKSPGSPFVGWTAPQSHGPVPTRVRDPSEWNDELGSRSADLHGVSGRLVGQDRAVMRDRRRGAHDESGRVCKGLDDERSLVLNAKRKGTQVGVDRVALDGNDLPGRRCGGGRGRVEGGDREGASDGDNDPTGRSHVSSPTISGIDVSFANRVSTRVTLSIC
jgi:hypothetical protein